VKLSQIEAFVAAADAGSIRAAARVLRLSQPAVTKALRALEDELGAALLRRTARGIELTPPGERFLTRARTVSREIERSREELLQDSHGRSGQVVIGSAPGAGALLLPNPIAQLGRVAPLVDIRVIEGMPHATLPRVRDGTFDFAIGPMPRDPLAPDLSASELFQIEMAIVVRRGHPQASARSVAALAGYDWMTAGLSSERNIVEEMFRSAELPPPRWRVQCESIPALIAIAARSDLVATIPRPLVALGIGSSLVQMVRVRESKPAARVCLFTKRDSPLTPPADRFAKLIRSEARRVG
jgi:LysR family transcriptional regulator, regulator of abg operon